MVWVASVAQSTRDVGSLAVVVHGKSATPGAPEVDVAVCLPHTVLECVSGRVAYPERRFITSEAEHRLENDPIYSLIHQLLQYSLRVVRVRGLAELPDELITPRAGTAIHSP